MSFEHETKAVLKFSNIFPQPLCTATQRRKRLLALLLHAENKDNKDQKAS
jgi:hypothetical protein